MSDKFPATDETFISEPLSDQELDRVSGGTLDRSMAPTDEAQLLQVQMVMQNENQEFTAVSNVLKTRHDTVKNSIGNIK